MCFDRARQNGAVYRKRTKRNGWDVQVCRSGTNHVTLKFLASIPPDGLIHGHQQAQVQIRAPADIAAKWNMTWHLDWVRIVVMNPPERPGAGSHHIRYGFADVDI